MNTEERDKIVNLLNRYKEWYSKMPKLDDMSETTAKVILGRTQFMFNDFTEMIEKLVRDNHAYSLPDTEINFDDILNS